MKKKWLILSHSFNMDGRAASLTITDKMPYLLKEGVKPIVLSAVTGCKDSRFFHHQLLAWGPSACSFDFRHWVANKYGRGLIYTILTRMVSLLLMPLMIIEKFCVGYSSQWSWAIPAFIRGYWLIRRGKVDLVYSTGGAWSAHLAGIWLKRVTGIHLISEVHDPLVKRNNFNDLGIQQPRNREARFRYYLEQLLCRYADYIWWFTDSALHYAKIRNPQLNTPGNAHGFVVIPGAEPPKTLLNLSDHCYSGHLNVCHFGSLANNRSFATILNAVIFVIKKYPESRAHIRIHAYGAPLDFLTLKACQQHHMEDVLMAHGRLEHDPVSGISGRERAIKKMQQADVLILLHGNDESCAEYIPSKLYEYFWVNRPIWGITYRNSQLEKMLVERGSYLSNEGDRDGIVNTLERIWLDWKQQNLLQPIYSPIGVEQAVNFILSQVKSLC